MLNLQTYDATLFNQLSAFCQAYLEQYPDAKLMSPEFYTYHPALKDRELVFGVFSEQGEMVGFAPLFPVITTDANGVTGPHEIWTILLAKPGMAAAVAIHHLLFDRVIAQVNRLKAEYGLAQVKLAADMMVSQQVDIDFLQQNGFVPFEQINVMNRDTAQAVPAVTTPPGIQFQQTKMATEEEQAAYLALYNTCFPQSPKNKEELRFLLDSDAWAKGCAIMAYSPANELVGSVLHYGQVETAVTDDVMVLPEWRGQKIAHGLIAQGLQFCRSQGIETVRLEVKATNAPAITVYTAMGYRQTNQETLLGILL